jgi:predicted RNase H-like HicB family nuclease
MKTLTYLAVLESEKEGGYSISFPDLPGCFSQGTDLEDARMMAEEAASLHIYGMEEDGEEIPVPSVSLPEAKTKGNIILAVTLHPDLFRANRDNERIKTNVTIPAWLKREAEIRKVNYSRLLENALIEYLKIPARALH